MLTLKEMTSRLDSSLYRIRRIIPHKDNTYTLVYAGTVPGKQDDWHLKAIAVHIGEMVFARIGGNYRAAGPAEITYAYYCNPSWETDYTITLQVSPC